jgi:hypothetical protein
LRSVFSRNIYTLNKTENVTAMPSYERDSPFLRGAVTDTPKHKQQLTKRHKALIIPPSFTTRVKKLTWLLSGKSRGANG